MIHNCLTSICMFTYLLLSLDQELISYRYSSCSSYWSCSCWGD